MIVAVPVAVPRVAFTGLERVTVNVSFTSSMVSLLTGTLIVALVWPGLRVRLPLVAL